MELSRVAELQVLLEGVPLPVGRDDLLRYAAHEGARPFQLELLRRLPSRRYQTIDEVGEKLARVQPPFAHEEPHRPHEESGAPPGGPAYTDPHPESGAVRDREAATT
ncbi:MAG TPA: DUF2795 domain-containing protein [Gaiellaceae bacterium]|nr:DUF2795 domain-containing protein [Gaiellaceae bacterium]